MLVVLDALDALDVIHLELEPLAVGCGNHVQVQPQTQQRDRRSAQKIRPHQPLEADAGRQNRDDLGLIGHLRGGRRCRR